MEKICKCGHDINHSKIIHETEYSKWGWFLLTALGLSAKPRFVKHLCSECGDLLMISNDPKILTKYIGR